MKELDSLILMILKSIASVVNTGEERVRVLTYLSMRKLRKHLLGWSLKIMSNNQAWFPSFLSQNPFTKNLSRWSSKLKMTKMKRLLKL